MKKPVVPKQASPQRNHQANPLYHIGAWRNGGRAFDYQSGCHCAKTKTIADVGSESFDYQSGCHCAKTNAWCVLSLPSLITSQDVTAPKQIRGYGRCRECLITSQDVTAPKQAVPHTESYPSLITSQDVTAPKHRYMPTDDLVKFDYQSGCHCAKTSLLLSSPRPCLITSQDVTAPKLSTVLHSTV